jgi:hypothetical protein
VFDWLFQLFFEYRPSVFAQGELRFAPAAGAYLAAAVAAVALVIAAYSYRTRAARANVRDRVVLLSLRVALLGLVVLCLFRPVLVVTAAVPQQNVVGVLLDDSRSMQIADVDGAPRAEYVRREFGARESGTLRALSDKFLVRTFFPGNLAARRPERVDVRGWTDQARRGARERTAGAGGSARGRPGGGE